MDNAEQNLPKKDAMEVFILHWRDYLVEEVSNEVIRKLSQKKIPKGNLTYKSGRLAWGDLSYDVERNTLMHFVCNFVFKTNKGVYVSWDEIYEAWAGKESSGDEWRKIYDAVKGLNEKSIKTFEIPIFHWKNKEVARLY